MRYEAGNSFEHILSEREYGELSRVFVATVAADLQEDVSLKRAREIQQSIGVASGLLEKMKVEPQYLNPQEPAEWERGALLLGMAAVWQGSVRGPFVPHRDVAKWLALLYAPDERRSVVYQPQDKDSYALDDDVLAAVFSRTWGRDDFDWVREHKAENHIVRLPYTAGISTGRKSFKEVLREVQADTGLVGSNILGVAFPEYQFAVVLEDADDVTEEHERAHVENANLFVRDFGISMNEGKTELVARQRCDGRKGTYGCVYKSEISLVNRITHMSPRMAELLDNRYKRLTAETARGFASGLIERYGLYKYMLAYTAHPEALSQNDLVYYDGPATRKDERLAFRKHYGLRSTQEVYNVLWRE